MSFIPRLYSWDEHDWDYRHEHERRKHAFRFFPSFAHSLYRLTNFEELKIESFRMVSGCIQQKTSMQLDFCLILLFLE